MEKKQAAFAGSWYPGTAAACETAIQGFLKDSLRKVTGRSFDGGVKKGL